MKSISALFACVFVSLLAVAGQANAGTVTVEITGHGAGSLNSIPFGPSAAFDLFLVGPDSNSNVIDLTTATASIGGGPANTFTQPMHIGLNLGGNYAFFGEVGGSDLLHLVFSPANFAALQNSNSFSAAPDSFTIFAFTNEPTSGGPLTFTSFTDLNLSAISTGHETPLPAALPLFAGGLGVIGLLARRRKQKAAALAA